MGLKRRLDRLEKSSAVLAEDHRPVYTMADFECEDDPVKLTNMFWAMEGRWGHPAVQGNDSPSHNPS